MSTSVSNEVHPTTAPVEEGPNAIASDANAASQTPAVTPAATTKTNTQEQPKNPKDQAKPSVKSGATFQNTDRAVFFTAREWKQRPFHNQRGEQNFILGSPENPYVRPFTKTIIEAPEKCFKTTIGKRLIAGMACGVSVFPSLPVNPKKRRVLYTHGELSVTELDDRTLTAVVGLPDECLDNLIEGRSLDASLITKEGQKALKELLDHFRPEVWVIDPWQSFITGFDENSQKDMGVAHKFIDEMIALYKLSVFIMVHEGKDRSKGMRGSSCTQGWRDTLIKLSPLKSKDAHGQLRLVGATIVVTPRWAEAPAAFTVTFGDGTVWEADPSKKAVVRKLRSTKPDATQAEIATLAGCSVRTVQEVDAELKKAESKSTFKATTTKMQADEAKLKIHIDRAAKFIGSCRGQTITIEQFKKQARVDDTFIEHFRFEVQKYGRFNRIAIEWIDEQAFRVEMPAGATQVPATNPVYESTSVKKES